MSHGASRRLVRASWASCGRLWCGLTQYAHPVSCAAAVGVIEVIEREQLVDNSDRIGAVMDRIRGSSSDSRS